MISLLSNHLWQSTLFVLAAGLVASALRKNGAHVRHRIWVIASLKFLVPFSLLMSLGAALPRFTPAAAPNAAPEVPGLAIAIDQIAQPFSEDAFVPAAPAESRAATSWMTIAIVLAWACGFGVVALMRLRGWRRIRAALKASVPFDLEHLSRLRSADRTSVRDEADREPGPPYVGIAVRSAPGLLEPGVVGLWRPVLFLPAGIEERLTPRQLEAVLAHELCHVRRRDNLTSAIHMVVEAAFWFHPLVWLVGARLIEERERACDEYVLRVCGAPEAYAEGILAVCKAYVESPLACVSGVTGSDLNRRVQAILAGASSRELGAIKRWALAAVAAGSIAIPIGIGAMAAPGRTASLQTGSDRPRFDVASVKACDTSGLAPGARGGGPGPGGMSPDRLTLNCQLVRGLIQAAYVMFPTGKSAGGVAVYRTPIEGGPDWINSERYTIEAKAAGPVETTMMQGPMLQTLLEDRFKLKIRHETREIPMYALTVAKGGPKLTPHVEGSCVALVMTMPPTPQPPLAPGQRRCAMVGRMKGPNWAIDAEGITIQRLVDAYLTGPLSGLDAQTIDRTGLQGTFDIHLEFAPAADNLALRDAIARGENPGEPTAPEITTAIQQLGLKLERTKGPGEFLVIEHVERPVPDDQVQQAPPRLKFDVASVKPCGPDSPPQVSRAGGAGQAASVGYLNLSCLTLRQFVSMAYDGPDSPLLNRHGGEDFVADLPKSIRGGPSWAYSETYTIEAKGDGVTDRKILTGPMLRAVLEERFQLKTHRATEQQSMYTLTVAKSGLKITPLAPGECWEHEPGKPDPPHARNEGPCGSFGGDGWGSHNAHGVWLGDPSREREGTRMVDLLWQAMLRNVIDKTGLNGRYSFALDFTPDDTTPGVQGPGRRGLTERPTTFKSSDTIFQALEKLGLHLAQTKAPAEYLVIDSAERPKPNPPNHPNLANLPNATNAGGSR
jgi:uncharacterized protein (TIGR03435 family)